MDPNREQSADDTGSSPHQDRNERLHALNAAARQLLGTDAARAAELARDALTLAGATATDEVGHSQLILGEALAFAGETDEARRQLEAAGETFERFGRVRARVDSLIALGRLLADTGQLNDAAARVSTALELLQEEADPRAEARALNLMARIQHTRGQPEQARQLLERILDLQRQLGDVAGQVNSLLNLGFTMTGFGRYREALDCFLSGYRLAREHLPGDLRAQAVALVNIGNLYLERQDLARARNAFETARSFGMESHDRRVQVAATTNLGEVLLELGETSQAEVLLREALSLAREARLASQEAQALGNLARIALMRGETGEALTAHREAVAIAVDLQDRAAEATRRLYHGEALLLAGRTDDATRELEAALLLAEDTNGTRVAGEAHRLLADAFEQAGDAVTALVHFRKYHLADKTLFNEESEWRAQELTGQLDVERAQHEAEMYRLRTQSAQQARAEAEAQVRARTEELEVAQLEVLTRLALAAEYRDDVTGKHTWRVGHFAARVAQALGMPEEDVEALRLAARLHDVGKIGIPDAVLLKPGKFTPGEYEQMKLHTLIGARILSGSRSSLLHMAETVALTHHERWDGAGYPRGLAGEAIPLVGRVVSVADVFDALTHARPYKEAWTREAALEELRVQRGRHFDPRVADAALEVFADPEFFVQLERELDEQAAMTPDLGHLRLHYRSEP